VLYGAFYFDATHLFTPPHKELHFLPRTFPCVSFGFGCDTCWLTSSALSAILVLSTLKWKVGREGREWVKRCGLRVCKNKTINMASSVKFRPRFGTRNLWETRLELKAENSLRISDVDLRNTNKCLWLELLCRLCSWAHENERMRGIYQLALHSNESLNLLPPFTQSLRKPTVLGAS